MLAINKMTEARMVNEITKAGWLIGIVIDEECAVMRITSHKGYHLFRLPLKPALREALTFVRGLK